MGKTNILTLFIISLFALSACTSSIGHETAVSGSAVDKQPEAMIGINKGNLPPDFTITTINGKQLNIRNFKNENKPILLYFWASWCPYCSQDFDVVKDIYPEYASKVIFLAIDLDLNEDAELIKNYKNKKGLEGIDFAAGNIDVLADYGVAFTTTKYAIGKDGLILYKGSGVFNEQQWEVLLNGVINS